ncbi:MAG: uracil-DNA glycosylase [Clostridiales bacterium]|nr:uracil-DNA glycosylase [Clostridiales bacterium]MCF8023580.1 uracil-DNA glycosylase [Clostridiales bacterium]
MTGTMLDVSELSENFSRRLIQSGYNSESVKKAVSKTARLMTHAVIINELTGPGERCSLCNLHKEGAARRLAGHGNPDSPIMFVGEGPGEHEDMFGIPFVGIAGTALTLWLEKMPLKREQVYISNVIKCRPENNRTPQPQECETCIENFLKKEIKMIKPRVIVAVGAVALKCMIPDATGITSSHGSWFKFEDIPLTPVYHPAFVLRKKNREFAEANQQVYRDLMQAFQQIKA